jgi:phosphatidate cytidylyltransferase
VLKHRVIAALVLIPLVVLSVLYLPTEAFAVLLAVVVLLGAWEWAQLVPLVSTAARIGLVAATGALLVLAWLLRRQDGFPQWLLLAALIWWCCAALWLVRPRWGTGRPVLKLAVSALTLLPPWFALVLLHLQSRELVLYVLVVVWVADSGAYFAGRHWGRHRLAPAVSPGKTWEGVAGGMAGGAAVAAAAGYFLGLSDAALLQFVMLGLVVIAVSILGDLSISLLKRQQGIKDSGHIIPGHGGILDRIDSLTAAAPVFAMGYEWLNLGSA